MRGPRTAMKSGPRLPQLEKALAQKRRPNTAKNKNKQINKLIKKKKKRIQNARETFNLIQLLEEYCKVIVHSLYSLDSNI